MSNQLQTNCTLVITSYVLIIIKLIFTILQNVTPMTILISGKHTNSF
jgi:hypothetical protein